MGGWAATRLAAARREVGALVPSYGYSQAADYQAMRAAVQAYLCQEDGNTDPAWLEEVTLLQHQPCHPKLP